MTHLAGRRWCGFTLIELVVVIGILVGVIALLLPALSKARKASVKFAAERAALAEQQGAGERKAVALGQSGTVLPQAVVKSFGAKVQLTPRLSVGTAEAESIYEAKVEADLVAGAGEEEKGGKCEIRMPLPPQVISLADLSVVVGGKESEDVSLRDGAVVWAGTLEGESVPVKVVYSAVGKGLYEIQTPPGKILDTFDLELVANGSDVRMLELSLQPTGVVHGGGRTAYTWSYKRLLFGRPISVDVLGVAPVDRLGELRWLGPVSVVVFGLVVGLYAHAYGLVQFDRWMLVLVLGAFTGAYPLMYFAQEFVPLMVAMVGAAGLMVVIIGVRAGTVIGWGNAVLGVVVPAIGVMAVTLVATTHPGLQGILLTGGAIAVFVVAMLLVPKMKLEIGRPPGLAGVVG